MPIQNLFNFYNTLSSQYFWVGIIIILIIILFYIAYRIFIGMIIEKGEINRSINKTLFQVVMPKYFIDQENKSDKELISVFDDFLSIFSEIKRKPKKFGIVPFSISLEIAATSNEINFYVTVPSAYETVIEKNIYGFYPSAQVYKIENYTIFHPNSVIAVEELNFEKKDILPIKTYKYFEADPTAVITNALSKLNEGEGAAIQIVFSTFKASVRQRDAMHIAREMQKGKTLEEATSMRKSIKKEDDTNKEFVSTQQHQNIIKSLEEKSSKAGFLTNIRLVTSSSSIERSQQILLELEGGFHQFSAGYLNNFIPLKVKSKEFLFDYTFRNFIAKKSIFLNTEEISSIFHFPLPSNKTPKIKWLSSARSP